jgi:enoyl-CoA hydratase
MSVSAEGGDNVNLDFETVLYQQPLDGVVRVVLNRPDQRNAQNLQMLYDLTAAFDRAVLDDSVKVIVLAGEGPHFSAGHDLKRTGKSQLGVDFPLKGNWGGFAQQGAHGRYAREQEIYLNLTRRWRNAAKPTIAQVHGACIAGGLMLAWACDLIIASTDATFCDPSVYFGSPGVEYFVHPWELGPRKAKEYLFTGETWSAEDARQRGMVNHVVPRDELPAFVLKMAQKICAKPLFSLALAKEAVNRCVDITGQQAAVDSIFGLHQLAHANNVQQFGRLLDPKGADLAVKNRAPGV